MQLLWLEAGVERPMAASLSVHFFFFFVFPSSVVPINFKTETQPINVESIKGQRNHDIDARSKTEAAFWALGKYNHKDR